MQILIHDIDVFIGRKFTKIVFLNEFLEVIFTCTIFVFGVRRNNAFKCIYFTDFT